MLYMPSSVPVVPSMALGPKRRQVSLAAGTRSDLDSNSECLARYPLSSMTILFVYYEYAM